MRPAILAAGGLACAGAAMTIAAFAAGGSDPPDGSGRAAVASEGLDVWLAQGCGSCHTFAPANAKGPIGPDLQATLRGKSHDYVLESIVLPDKELATGFSAGTMPDDYARRIAPQDLEPLVEFLMDGAAR